MKKITLVFCLAIFPMFTAQLNADIYKYIDENGQKRWTDDLSQVPPEQRSTVKRLETEDDVPVPPNQVTGDDQQADTSDGIDTKTPGTDAGDENANLDREALKREKSDLNALYKELIAEKEQLEKAKAKATNVEAQKELAQKFNAFNEKAKAYDKRLEIFNQKASQYNQRIRATQKSD